VSGGVTSAVVRLDERGASAGAYTRPLFSST